MNKEDAGNYASAIVFACVIVGVGVGVMLASAPALVFNHFDGAIIGIIGLAVCFILLYRMEKAGYEIEVMEVTKEGENEQ